MIKADNLSFYYQKGAMPAVDSVSFTIDKGEIFGFLGPNGAGKSTTQKILTSQLKGYRGKIEVLGKNLENWGKALYEKIGIGFEFPNNYQKLTGLENLSFFRSLYNGETQDPMELLIMVGLGDDARTKVANYSKGMQMRLNFARALLNKPQVLFLDEPTSGLDPVSARNIKDLILNEKEKGHTVFLTTHNMFIADELCDRVGFIVDGKLKVVDSPERLKIAEGRRLLSVGYLEKDELKHQEFSLDKLGDNQSFIELLRKETIKTIHTKESTLEEIFIRVTGRNLQ